MKWNNLNKSKNLTPSLNPSQKIEVCFYGDLEAMDREFFRYRYMIIKYAKYSIFYNLWILFPLIFVLDCTYDTVKLIKISFGLPEFQLLYLKGSSPNSHTQVPSCLSSVPPIQASPALITTSKRTIKTLEENYSHSLTKKLLLELPRLVMCIKARSF